MPDPKPSYAVRPPKAVNVTEERLVQVPLYKEITKPVTVKVDRLQKYDVDKTATPSIERVCIREVKVPIERIIESVIAVPIHVPKEKTVEKIVEVPYDRTVEKTVEVTREKIVEVPRTRVVKRKKIVPVEKTIERTVEVPVEQYVTRRVEVPFERVIEKIEEIPVEKVVEVRVEVTVPIINERIVHVERDIIMDKVVEVEVDEELVAVPVPEQHIETVAPRRVTLEDQGYRPPKPVDTEWALQLRDEQMKAVREQKIYEASHDDGVVRRRSLMDSYGPHLSTLSQYSGPRVSRQLSDPGFFMYPQGGEHRFPSRSSRTNQMPTYL